MKILEPLYYAVSWIMVQFHHVFTSMGFDPAGGWAWGLSIVGLVVVIRILLIPLFVKQIHAQRGLQMLQPEIKKIQERYKNDRERQSQELMKLYKETGTNPLASCLPIIAQAPIFIALFRVLNKVGHHDAIGAMSAKLAEQAANATILGAPISARFIGADSLNVKLVTAGMIVLMSASTFITQKQLMTKNMPASAMNNPFAQQQKILLYVFPIIFAVSGVNFPVGVLLYWLTTNVWTMGQQLYVIRRNPTPGSIAHDNLEARRAQKRKPDSAAPAPAAEESAAERPTGQRQQPKRQPRTKRTGAAARPAGSANGAAAAEGDGSVVDAGPTADAGPGTTSPTDTSSSPTSRTTGPTTKSPTSKGPTTKSPGAGSGRPERPGGRQRKTGS